VTEAAIPSYGGWRPLLGIMWVVMLWSCVRVLRCRPRSRWRWRLPRPAPTELSWSRWNMR